MELFSTNKTIYQGNVGDTTNNKKVSKMIYGFVDPVLIQMTWTFLGFWCSSTVIMILLHCQIPQMSGGRTYWISPNKVKQT